MTIQITDPQKHQIMQTPEFAAKLSELMRGFEPIVSLDTAITELLVKSLHAYLIIPYSVIKFPLRDYALLVSACFREWDGIMWQKHCTGVQSLSPQQIGLTIDEYVTLIGFAQDVLTQIDAELEKQKEKAIQAVFLAQKAKNSIIHA